MMVDWLFAEAHIITFLLCCLDSRFSKMFFQRNQSGNKVQHLIKNVLMYEEVIDTIMYVTETKSLLWSGSLLVLEHNATIVWINLVSTSGWRGKSKWQTQEWNKLPVAAAAAAAADHLSRPSERGIHP